MDTETIENSSEIVSSYIEQLHIEITELKAKNSALKAEKFDLRAKYSHLESKYTALEAQINKLGIKKTSENSSIPLSKDFTRKNISLRKKSDKRSAGQMAQLLCLMALPMLSKM